MHAKTCSHPWCNKPFEVTDTDLAFLEKVSPVFAGKKEMIPPPTLCFPCRLQRRTAFYNCRSLYRRTCDFSGKPIISIFSPDKKCTVYDKDIWFSDQWDPLSYGRPFDFNRPFFEQFSELLQVVPLQSISHFGWANINSDYTNDNYKIKNCYLCFDGEQAEDCYYLNSYVRDRNCVDCLHITDSELCYECMHCAESYALRYSRFCTNCSESWFLRDCIGCKNCFGCANLRQKQYCIFGQQKTKEEYEVFLQAFDSSSHAAVQAMRSKSEELFLQSPVKELHGEQNVMSSGDTINHCKNAQWCFDCNDQEDCKYATSCMMSSKDTLDVHVWGDGLELAYDSCVVGADARSILFSYNISQGCSDILYSAYCQNSCASLFGCSGLKRKKHCILNKQYTQEEYESLVPRIIEHMRRTGEWGHFFPQNIALFGYNETMGQTYFPMQREEVLARGWLWSDYEASVEARRVVDAGQLPDNVADIPDDILQWAIRCEVSGKPFKLTKQELDFYRFQKLPLPRRHPDQRHRDRFALKNPFMLFDRTCANCHKPIATSYPLDRRERVVCEDCYLKEVY